MPSHEGIEVAQELGRRGNKAKIVFLTIHEDVDIAEKCRKAGGLGYVMLMDTDLILVMNEALNSRIFISRFP
jgi:FixJ family two-component response regulator